MFQRIISFSVGNPLVIGVGVLALIVWGVVSASNLPIDAVPDITNNQVQVVTLSPALAPQEIERLITIPVEQNMATIDGIVERRSLSRFGLSVVTLVFRDDVDLYWAREQVNQRLSEGQSSIPRQMGSPTMMPITTGLGEIFQYTLQVDSEHRNSYTLTRLRTIHDWFIRRSLLGTSGVADVASFGGHLRQLEVAVQPELLASMGLTMADVLEKIQSNNGNSGGAYIERGTSVAFVRTEGMITTADDVANIPLRISDGGVPLTIADVAEVRDGHAIRYGALTSGDSSEAVGGIVYMLKGANSAQVIATVKDRIAQIERTLPAGIHIVPFFDRSALVGRTISTVSTNLIEGALIVVFVLVLLLGNLRAGFIVASVIPLSMLFAISMMKLFGVSGNLMSLGAIDFGLIVDGAVIIVEHALHKLSHVPRLSKLDRRMLIKNAALEIRNSVAFGEGIILIVYLPILVLVGIEGKMFVPMAQTVMFAIVGALLLSTTYVPMMAALLLKEAHYSNRSISQRIMDRIGVWYSGIRRYTLRRPLSVLGFAIASLVIAVFAFTRMGGEFIPTLEEGDFAVEVRLPTGSSLSETIKTTHKAAHLLQTTFPEVVQVIGKIGSTEIPLDPMPMEACDLMIILKPKAEWTSATTREALADTIQRTLEKIPGVLFGVQQPIQMRFNELMTGARQDVVVKVYGDDMVKLAALGEKIGKVAGRIPGAADVFVEKVGGLPQIVVRINREACAVFNVNIDDVNTTVRSAFAGMPAGELYEGEQRFDIVVRLGAEHRKSIVDLEMLTLNTQSGDLIPLTQVATIDYLNGPTQVQRENGRRRITIGFNVRDRDVQSIVSELKREVGTVVLPDGYEITYGGQFENLEHAMSRLSAAVPAALIMIVFLLYVTFRSIGETVMVFTAVPFAAIGGVAALVVRGMPFSISAGIGFIALFGVAVLNGIVLMASFKRKADVGYAPVSVVVRGTTDRLRPVVMTALVASLGFLPMAISTSDGAEVQRPLATVVIGGLITSTILTLVVLPALYLLTATRRRKGVKAGTVVVSMLLGACLLSSTSANGQPTVLSRDSVRALSFNTNLEVLIAQNQIQQAEKLKSAAVDIGSTNITWIGGQYNSSFFDNSFGINQTIPWPGKLAANSNVYEQLLQEATLEGKITRRQIMARIEQSMDKIAYTRELLSVYDKLDSVLTRTVRTIRTRTQVGDATELERLQHEGQLSELRSQRAQRTAQLLDAEDDLRTLCGGIRVTIADTTLARRQKPQSATLAPAVTSRLEQKVHTAEAQYQLATSQWWPDIQLAYTNQSLIGTPLTNNPSAVAADRFQYVTVGLALPLWFGPINSRAGAAELGMQIASVESKQRLELLKMEFAKQLRSIDAFEVALNHYDGPALAESRTLVDHSARAYEAGSIGWVELQRATERALNIQLNRLQTLFNYNCAVIQFEQITGAQP